MAYILRKLHVIHAVSDGNKFDFHLFEISIGKNGIMIDKCLEYISLEDIVAQKFSNPVILTISGRGVISKEYKKNSEESKQITDRPDDFLFAIEDLEDGMIRVIFLRRKLYDLLCRQLIVDRLSLVEVRIDVNNNPEQEARKAAEEFWRNKFGIKEVFSPSMRSNNLLSLVVRKILLPVLSSFLGVLLINFFVQQEFAGQLREQQFLLAQAKKNTTQVEKSLGERQEILNHLGNETKYPYAWIADRIASVVPKGIVLTELIIQPLKDKIQEKKTINVEKNKVVVRGRGIDPTSVTAFTDSIRVLNVFSTVQLIMQHKDKSDNYLFTLNASL